MSSETEWSCPICRDVEDDIAYAMPCRHRFCLGCILRWAKRNVSCPLCRQPIKTIIYSVRSEEDFLEMALPGTPHPLDTGHGDGQELVEEVPITFVGGFPTEFWARLFRDSMDSLELVLTWVEETLSQAQWWDVASAQGNIILNLCHHGLNEQALIEDLQPILQDQTATFVRQLICVAVDQGHEVMLRQMELLDSSAAGEQEHRSADSHDSYTFQGETPAPSHNVQELSHEEPGQVEAEPSTSGQGRDCSWRGPQSSPHRKGRGSQASSGNNRPHCGQH